MLEVNNLFLEMILIVYSTQYWANPKPLPGHLVNQLDVSMSFCKLLVCLMNGNIKKQNQCNILFFLAAHQIYSRIDFIFINNRMLPLLR